MVILNSTKSDFAYVTWVNDDYYAIGALVLAHSLRTVHAKYPLHLMYSDGISCTILNLLKAVYDKTSYCSVISSTNLENLALSHRPGLASTLTKINCWRLFSYSKCVFLDADTLVIQNIDELFERPSFTAAPDFGWPDFFNAGVFVYEPSEDIYRSLLDLVISQETWDGGFQGLLNNFYNDWNKLSEPHRLPFTYNVCPNAGLGYKAALKVVATNIKIIHFMGFDKPWLNISITGMPCFWAYWQYIFHHKVRKDVPKELYDGPNNQEHVSILAMGLPDYKIAHSYGNFIPHIKQYLCS